MPLTRAILALLLTHVLLAVDGGRCTTLLTLIARLDCRRSSCCRSLVIDRPLGIDLRAPTGGQAQRQKCGDCKLFHVVPLLAPSKTAVG